MLLLTDYELKFKVDSTQEFLDLKNAISQYNWSTDPAVAMLMNKDPAFKDSFVMQCCLTDKMLKLNPSINFKYQNTNIEVLVEKLTNKVIEKFNSITLLKSMLVALIPHGSQTPHKDISKYHQLGHRFIIPLTGNNCFTYFEGRPASFEFGGVYEMNNQINHYSVNNGDQIRVTMFVDVVPNHQMEAINNIIAAQSI